MALKPTKKIWMDGKFVNWDDATIHVCAHVVHYGTAVFEGIRCYNTKKGPMIFRLQPHIKRLYNSAKMYRMEPTAITMREIHGGVRRNGARQRPEGMLHQARRLSRLQRARRVSR